MKSNKPKAIGVLTSGGDAQGMNAALRAVVRTALSKGIAAFAIYEGYQGMVEGGNFIHQMNWNSVGGIMHRGGTIIGTARSADFRTHEGRLKAAKNLLERGIDSLVIVGGDGSLTGANLFRSEWSELLQELVQTGQISHNLADEHSFLKIVGLVGSIDNDMCGTDMTIGADSALHRITEAIDSLTSTAASHQRTFVVEVMGRNCGYLAMMSAVSGGSDWVLIPENPPKGDNWEQRMCDVIKAGRKAGRRDTIIVVAEGSRDAQGNPIRSEYIRKVLEERLGEETRVTILGHVQRGGAPSAFDRWMSTLMGSAAIEELLNATPESEAQMIGMRYNRITHTPLMQCVKDTHEVAHVIGEHDYGKAMELRGGSFTEMFYTFQALAQASPTVKPNSKSKRIGILMAGAPAPGMNTAARAATRLTLDKGHSVVAIHNGFQGLIKGELEEFSWGSVEGWVSRGGAELGTTLTVPSGHELYSIAKVIETSKLDALLIIGGLSGYEAAYRLYSERKNFPAFNIPMVCIPASINNNLPGSEISIGADTALNSIVEVVDKIKQSAVASRRCFVVEVKGNYCGYLALMTGLATGAERVYLHEEGIRLRDLQEDLQNMQAAFQQGKRLSLIIRNEKANHLYTADFMRTLFEEESGNLFDVRQAIIGHMQQGGNPSPFDRIQATRFAARAVDHIINQLTTGKNTSAFVGIEHGVLRVFSLEEMPRLYDAEFRRPKEQWWLELKTIVETLAQENLK